MTITRVTIVLAAILVLFPCWLAADGSQTGTIDGRVLDAEGQPLPGALVRLTSALGEKTATTDPDGSFRFGLLGPADYVLSASLEGLVSTEISAPLDAGARRTIDLTLRASTAEAITVTADAVLVDPYVIGSSARVEGEVAEELSFRNRHYQSAVEVLPGVVHDATSRGQGDVKFAVNGGQDTEVAGFVDGVDISFSRFNGSPRLFLPTTALQEFGLDSAGFATEYGRVVGGISNAVVKSGTNDFHGSFLYIPQNQKWRAPYDAIDIPREDDIIDSFETSFGGPIYRDKAWFFAAYAETTTNQLDRFPDGSAVDVSFQNEVKIGKVTLQPSPRHHLALLGVDSPVHKNHIEPNSGDRFTPCTCDLGGEVLTVNWGFSITSSLFLEVKAADQENSLLRENAVSRTLTPGASPDSPMGNNFSYQDRGSGLLHNTIGQPAGTGFLIIPRDQANGSLSLFQGSHELKFGVDYQDVEMQTLNVIGKRYFGMGYDENLIGGFRTPQVLDVFDPSQVITTTSDVLSVYAQDRWDFTERWNLFAGVRLDEQKQENEIGEEAVSYTKWAPRLALVYDVAGTGRLLLKGFAGRYYQIINQDFVSAEFGRLPNGRNLFDEFGWNAATQRYDIFVRRVVPVLNNFIPDIDPYYKDEATIGTEWQFTENWVFEAQAIWWELDDLAWATDQFNSEGRVVRDVRNWDDGFREYRGLRLELSRAFRGGWTMMSNYTWGEGDGNNFGAAENVVLHNDDLFEALGGVEVGTGRTDATIINREGRGPFDRTHILNLTGLKNFTLGNHKIGVGGYFAFRSGERWAQRLATQIRHPVSGQNIATTTYRVPRDSEQLEDTYTLNLTGTWTFPIKGRFAGRVGIEAVNVTNEQEVIGINRANAQPLPGVTAFQTPREYRGQIGIEF
jgi:hypothetical protein